VVRADEVWGVKQPQPNAIRHIPSKINLVGTSGTTDYANEPSATHEPQEHELKG